MPRRSRKKRNNGFPFLLFLLMVGGILFFLYKHPDFRPFELPPITPPPTTQPTQPIHPPNSISIASFNIRIFTSNSRGDEELKYIVNILKKYDVVAIQELRDQTALKRTIAQLRDQGLDYGYDISPPVGRESKELYAFIYRKDKIALLKRGQVYQDVDDEFIREPFYASFKSGDFDFTLITVHILYGKNKTARRPEIQELSQVYASIQNEDPKENDVILLGDFNMSPDDQSFSWLKIIPTMTCTIAAPEKTTISDSNLLDNLCFERRFVKEYSGNAGVNRFDETMFNNDDEKASRYVSDHRLIWSQYDIPDQDDD